MTPSSIENHESPPQNVLNLDRRSSSQDSGNDAVSLLEYWFILKRRRYVFALPAIAIVLGILIYALNITPIYRSVATILIEDHEVSEDIIGASISNYASQQVQLVSQRLFTVSNIKEIIERFEVYGPKDLIEGVPDTLLVEWFRRDMNLDFVSAEILGPDGDAIEAAVAFTLAFKSPDPVLAQSVTQEMLALFLSENKRSSTSRATGVSDLLRTAVVTANEELLASESALADFKVTNEGALPELYGLNLNVINRSQEQLADLQLRSQELEQRKLQLSVQLASLSPSAAVTLPSGETVMSDRDRLRALLIDYRRKSAIYQTGHPDLERLTREIETLQESVGGTDTYTLLQDQLRQERDTLSGLRERYSNDHPDIKYSEAAIAELESQLSRVNRRESAPVEVADNPAYVLINTQSQAVDLEIRSLLQRRRVLRANIAEHEALIRQAPRVEMEYQVLVRAYETAKTKYDDLHEKLRSADVAANVEQEITGQRFTVNELPVLPVEAEPRRRLAILVLGLLLGVAVGAGSVVVAEYADNSIRGSRVLANIVGTPPLAVIPYLNNSLDMAHARKRRILVIGASFAGTALLIVYATYFV